jgi:hypothetical protein
VGQRHHLKNGAFYLLEDITTTTAATAAGQC